MASALRDLSPYQSRYAAWLHLTGGGPAYEYIIWISRRLADFRRRHGLRDEFLSRDENDRFATWLTEVAFGEPAAREKEGR